jgi:hypothetical protein
MPNARSLALALALIAAAVLAACGGSASPPAASPNAEHGGVEPAAIQNPLINSGDASGASRSSIVPSLDRISNSNSTPSVARYPMGSGNDEVSNTGADAVKPCRLVARVGLQGPTCIYAARGSRRQVTVVVERIPLAGLRSHALRSSRVRVRGRAGWCLHYGSTSVAVPVGGGRLLSVTGPCSTAARFAARALHRVPR